MGKRVIGLAALGAVLAATAVRAQPVVARTVYAVHTLRAGAASAFTASCPRGYLAVSGGVARPARGTRLLGMQPLGAESLRFRFGNPSGNGARRVQVALACRKAAGGGPSLRLKAVGRTIVIGPHAARSAALACPAGAIPGGAGFEGAAGGAVASTRAVVATRSGFRFTIGNAARRAARVVVHGSCLRPVGRAGSSLAPLRVRITTFADPAGAGLRSIGHRCRSGWVALGTGYSLRSAALRVEGAVALGRGGRWWVASRSSQATVLLQLVCARLGA
jgi:hypothetical protein